MTGAATDPGLDSKAPGGSVFDVVDNPKVCSDSSVTDMVPKVRLIT